MTGVYYFSATGHSEAVARYFADTMDAPMCPVEQENSEVLTTAVVVFPVYCQNIPAPVKDFLSALKAENIVLIATYGRMGYGNVLWEAAQRITGQVIAAAFVPTGHSYLREEVPVDYVSLQPILERIAHPRPAALPKLRKWWLADLLPNIRGRLSVKLQRNGNCTQCGLCNAKCPMGTMNNGIPGKACIRCLRCVSQCPEEALQFSCGPVLRWYLRKPRQTETVLYL